jgi:hypothetical protein
VLSIFPDTTKDGASGVGKEPSLKTNKIMKQHRITATVFILFFQLMNHTIIAQDTAKKNIMQNITLSTRAGLSITSLSAAHTDGFRFTGRLGYLLGVYAEYRMPLKKTGWVAGLQYSARGATIKPASTVLYDFISYNITYADLVLGGVYYPSEKIKLEAAIVPSLKIGENISYSGASGLVTGSAAANDISVFDAGIMAGASFYFKKYTLATNYTYGLRSIDKKQAGTGFSGLKNRAFTVSLQYNFSL